jgi:hypothetical protein
LKPLDASASMLIHERLVQIASPRNTSRAETDCKQIEIAPPIPANSFESYIYPYTVNASLMLLGLGVVIYSSKERSKKNAI